MNSKEWMKQTGDIENHVLVPRARSGKVTSVVTSIWLSHASDDEHAQGAVMRSEDPESLVPQNQGLARRYDNGVGFLV